MNHTDVVDTRLAGSLPPVVAARWKRALDAAVDWHVPHTHTVVVVPHPDDEVLMFGGLIADQIAAGVSIDVVAVTDGEAAYPEIAPVELARRRRCEQRSALRELGDRRVEPIRLGLPDGEVEAHAGTVHDAIADLRRPGSIIAAPWHLDHHCDHEAIGRAALEVAAHHGDLLVQGIFWGWHHRTPTDISQPLCRLRLSDDASRRRWMALQCHASQLRSDDHAPVLDDAALEPMGWPFEYHLAVPAAGGDRS